MKRSAAGGASRTKGAGSWLWGPDHFWALTSSVVPFGGPRTASGSTTPLFRRRKSNEGSRSPYRSERFQTRERCRNHGARLATCKNLPKTQCGSAISPDPQTQVPDLQPVPDGRGWDRTSDLPRVNGERMATRG